MLNFETREFQLVRTINGKDSNVLAAGSEDYCIAQLFADSAKVAKHRSVWMNTDASLNYYNEDDETVRLFVRPSNVAIESFGKIQAIKALRIIVPMSLVDAKHTIEAGMEHYGLKAGEHMSAAQLLATIRAYRKTV